MVTEQPNKQLKEKPTISMDDIDRIVPERAALAWENFLKRLGSDMPEDEARELLINDLRGCLNKKDKPSSVILWGSPEIRVGELKLYLLGEIDAASLRTYQELAGGSHSRE